MSYNVNIDEAIELLRMIRALTGNRRGRMSTRALSIADNIMENIRTECLDITRSTLRNNLSEGPALSGNWMTQKKNSWEGKWYDVGGDTVQIPRPSFAKGPEHKGVWTGFIDSQLNAWINPYSIREGASISVGYKGNALHPIQGIDEVTLAKWIHLGTMVKTGTMSVGIPPRPFINARSNMEKMRKATLSIIRQSIENMLTGGTA